MSDDKHTLMAWISTILAIPLLIVGWLAGWSWHWLHIAYLAGYYGIEAVKGETSARLVAAQTRRDTAFRKMRDLLDDYEDTRH